MAVIEINDKNIKEHTKKCVVLKMHRHAGINLIPGSIVTKEGEFLYDAINRGLVRLYDPALDEDDPTQEVKSKKQEVTINDDTSNGFPLASSDKEKKLGPKRKKKTS